MDEIEGNESSHSQQSDERPLLPSELFIKDDPLCEDILDCISKLDEVIAEFDDTNGGSASIILPSAGNSSLGSNVGAGMYSDTGAESEGRDGRHGSHNGLGSGTYQKKRPSSQLIYVNGVPSGFTSSAPSTPSKRSLSMKESNNVGKAKSGIPVFANSSLMSGLKPVTREVLKDKQQNAPKGNEVSDIKGTFVHALGPTHWNGSNGGTYSKASGKALVRHVHEGTADDDLSRRANVLNETYYEENSLNTCGPATSNDHKQRNGHPGILKKENNLGRKDDNTKLKTPINGVDREGEGGQKGGSYPKVKSRGPFIETSSVKMKSEDGSDRKLLLQSIVSPLRVPSGGSSSCGRASALQNSFRDTEKTNGGNFLKGFPAKSQESSLISMKEQWNFHTDDNLPRSLRKNKRAREDVQVTRGIEEEPEGGRNHRDEDLMGVTNEARSSHGSKSKAKIFKALSKQEDFGERKALKQLGRNGSFQFQEGMSNFNCNSATKFFVPLDQSEIGEANTIEHDPTHLMKHGDDKHHGLEMVQGGENLNFRNENDSALGSSFPKGNSQLIDRETSMNKYSSSNCGSSSSSESSDIRFSPESPCSSVTKDEKGKRFGFNPTKNRFNERRRNPDVQNKDEVGLKLIKQCPSSPKFRRCQGTDFIRNIPKSTTYHVNNCQNNLNNNNVYNENGENANFSPVLLNGNHHLNPDVDDGYLSMINKNEMLHLWPEELIQNETFSAEEMRRLSDTGVPHNGNDIVLNNYMGPTQPSKRRDRRERRIDKMDRWEHDEHFSDDSLEEYQDEHSSGPTTFLIEAPSVYLKNHSRVNSACSDAGIENIVLRDEDRRGPAPTHFILGPNDNEKSEKEVVRNRKKPCTFFVPLEDAEENKDGGGRKKSLSSMSPSLFAKDLTEMGNMDVNFNKNRLEFKGNLGSNVSSSDSGANSDHSSGVEVASNTETNNPSPELKMVNEGECKFTRNECYENSSHNSGMEEEGGSKVMLSSGFNDETKTALTCQPCYMSSMSSPSQTGTSDLHGIDKRGNVSGVEAVGGVRDVVRVKDNKLSADVMESIMKKIIDEERNEPASLVDDEDKSANLTNINRKTEREKGECRGKANETNIKNQKKSKRKGKMKDEDLKETELMAQELEDAVNKFFSANEKFLDELNDIDKRKASSKVNEDPVNLSLSLKESCEEETVRGDEKAERDKGKLQEQESTPSHCQNDNSHNVTAVGNKSTSLDDCEASIDDMGQPLMHSTPYPDQHVREVLGLTKGKDSTIDDDTKVEQPEISGEDGSKQSDLPAAVEDETIEGLSQSPPEFIPTPPPGAKDSLQPDDTLKTGSLFVQKRQKRASSCLNSSKGRHGMDILSERLNKFHGAEENIPVSNFMHDKKNIWAMYDRPCDDDLLTVSNGRSYASRSQENLVDLISKERLHVNSRGQSSTLPLNCRPPCQKRTSTFRSILQKLKKNKNGASGSLTINEFPELKDEEVQSITSRETRQSDVTKKRGFFSRLFRRKKNKT